MGNSRETYLVNKITYNFLNATKLFFNYLYLYASIVRKKIPK